MIYKNEKHRLACSASSKSDPRASMSLAYPLLIAALVFSNTADAMKLIHPDTVEHTAGELLSQTIEWQKTPGQRIEIKLGDAPGGAKLLVNRDGQLYVSWQTGSDLPMKSTLLLFVRDVDTQKIIDKSQLIVVRKVGQAQAPDATTFSVQSEQPNLVVEQKKVLAVKREIVTQQDVTQSVSHWKAPQLNPLPNQIISAGRVVSFQVKPVIDDDEQALLKIDRLPRNASFDENTDGSRTFYWRTSDQDQGEHLFRFTAIHPKDKNLYTWREILIVVGDPLRSSTAPLKSAQSSLE